MKLEKFSMINFQYSDQSLMTKNKNTKSPQNRIKVEGKQGPRLNTRIECHGGKLIVA